MYKFYVNERRVALEWELSLSPLQTRRKLKNFYSAGFQNVQHCCHDGCAVETCLQN